MTQALEVHARLHTRLRRQEKLAGATGRQKCVGSIRNAPSTAKETSLGCDTDKFSNGACACPCMHNGGEPLQLGDELPACSRVGLCGSSGKQGVAEGREAWLYREQA